MKVKENKWSVSSRDLFRGLNCEHCTRISMAVAAGVSEVIARTAPFEEDLGTKLPIIQGNQREAIVFEQIQHSIGVDNFAYLDDFSVESTQQAMAQGVPVIAQAYLELVPGPYRWSGVADLLVRDDFDLVQNEDLTISAVKSNRATTSTYRPFDVKNASSVSDMYKVQLGSYVHALKEMGVGSTANPGIILSLGNGVIECDQAECASLFQEALAKTLETVSLVGPSEINETFVLGWMCEKPSLCKKIYCEYPGLCEETFIATGDIGVLHQKHHTHLPKIRSAGIKTVAELASSGKAPSIAGLSEEVVSYYHLGAQLHLLESEGNKAIAALIQGKPELPQATEADLFFDIEWFNPVDSVDPVVFMFGVISRDGSFSYFETTEASEEKQKFQEFVEWAILKLEMNPDLRIYHVNNPEVTEMRKLVQRHGGFLETEVERLVDRMVDIQKIARASFVPGCASYSIKDLEKYYPDREKLRIGKEVSAGDDAMYKYHLVQEAKKANDQDLATKLMTDIRNYNRDDCLSTQMLYDWMNSLEFENSGQIKIIA